MGLRVKMYGPHSQQLADGRLVIDHKDLAAAYPQKVSPLAAAEAAAYRGSAEAAAHRAPMKAAESAGAHPSAEPAPTPHSSALSICTVRNEHRHQQQRCCTNGPKPFHGRLLDAQLI